jgi:Acetyltransferase (GNAT) domain
MSAVASPISAKMEAAASVQPLHPARQAGWDESVARHPHGSFFHSAEWAGVLEGAYGYVPAYFAVSEGGTLRSLLALMEVDSWLTGRRGVSLPFTDDCEPLCSDDESFKQVLQSVIAYGRARGWKYVEFRGGRKLFGEAPASLEFYGHELDLTGGEAALSGRVESSVRRAIRKAEKEGVTVEVSDTLEAMRIFYGLLCKTRRKHGMPPQPFHFFQNVHEQVLSKKLGVVVTARHEGRAIASSVYFGFGSRAIYKYGASDEAFQHLRGNNLVMWEAIKWHAQKGFKTLHLGRTSLGNEGLRRFKLGWGATEQCIEYVKYDLRHDRFVTDKDESAGWHNKVFSHLPIFLSRMIGAGLYKHWA